MGDVLFEKACDEEYDRGYEDGMNDAVKHGRWIDKYNDGNWHCSECGAIVEKNEQNRHNWYRCYHCGAKMDKANEDEL